MAGGASEILPVMQGKILTQNWWRTSQTALFLPGFFLATLGIFIAFYRLLNPDAAYFLEFSERLLSGERLYQDIIDNQFPAIYLISTFLVWISSVFKFSVVGTFFTFVFLLLNSSIFLSWKIIKINPLFQKHFDQLLFITLLYYALFILPYIGGGWWDSFGQREHLFCAFILPYIALAINRIQLIQNNQKLAIVSGLLAGIGFAIKPHFLLIFIASELFMICWSKNILAWLKTESVIILVMLTTYILTMIFFIPEYFLSIPYFVDLLQAVAIPWLGMILLCALFALVPLLSFMGYFVDKKSRASWYFVPYLFVLGCTSILTFALSLHAANYHSFPYKLFVLLLVGLMIFVNSRKITRIFFLTFLAALMIQYGIQNYSTVQVQRGFTFKMAEKIRQHASHGIVVPLDVVFAFPAITYAEARRGLSIGYLWYIPFAYQAYLDKASPPPYHAPNQMGKTERFFHESVMRNLEKEPPQLIMINNASQKWWLGRMQFNFIDYYSLDPRFRKFWKNYQRVDSLSDPMTDFQFVFYKRMK